MPSNLAKQQAAPAAPPPPALAKEFRNHRIIRRNGQIVPFDSEKIFNAIKLAFVEVAQTNGGVTPEIDGHVARAVDKTLEALLARFRRERNLTFAIEDIQDQVELALSRCGFNKVGSAYHSYREERAEKRRARVRELLPESFGIVQPDGSSKQLDPAKMLDRLAAACQGLGEEVDAQLLFKRVVSSLHEGITRDAMHQALVLEAANLIEQHYNYSKVAARLLLDALLEEVMGQPTTRAEMVNHYPGSLAKMVSAGIAAGRIKPELQREFDLHRLGEALKPERDDKLDYLGLQTLYDRYLLKDRSGRRIETPQLLWMRVAMGLALNPEEEGQRTERAIEFYELLSSFRYLSSTPTLFNSGTVFSQLSSCYLSTVADDLEGIYGAISDNAMLSKYAGGLGNDWTQVRAMGSYIQGTGGNSQGVVPFLRVVNDTAVAVNQGGKRKGAVCSYLETWHGDVEEFQDLRKNTGDERRRTHDMNTANWVPDLFMQRVRNQGQWTLFSPSDVPDLHDLYGKEFVQRYEEYEQQHANGKLPGRTIEAFDLWRDMITQLYETGHPWVTFKDPCNIRSPQRHAGVVHSSNLCTEITLNTKSGKGDEQGEIAVCNLGSINLAQHLGDDGKLDQDLLRQSVQTAMRMLDNVIDINYYAVDKAAYSNSQHRPVGLGQVGYQDCLHRMGLAFDAAEAIEFADEATEMICYYAYEASSELAKERGKYPSYKGSLWSQGVMPLDSLRLLAEERLQEGEEIVEDGDWLRSPGLEVNIKSRLDWDKLRRKIKKDGMRNSNCIAIAPTATIGNIMGASPCIEPDYKMLFAKSNLSGEFTVVNKFFMDEMLAAGLWNDSLRSQLKAADGEIAGIEEIPEQIRARFKTCFQLDQKSLVEAASRRQKWIDQSQSLNLFMKTASGQDISDVYFHAWRRGLKTTYYCRTQAASKTEKFTTETTGDLNNVEVQTDPKQCAIDDPDCEACQ